MHSGIRAVLEGKRFVSASLARYDFDDLNLQTAEHSRSDKVLRFRMPVGAGRTQHHEVGFYSNDRHFLDHVTRFIAAALKAENAAIVVATESHRRSLLSELRAEGLDVTAAVKEGRYIPLDAADTLSTFMVNGMPDPVRFLELLGDLVMTAGDAAKTGNPRVSLFGECVHLLWEQGNLEAAIQMEKLGNKLTQMYAVDVLCGYFLGSAASEMDDYIFERICTEHSAVHSG